MLDDQLVEIEIDEKILPEIMARLFSLLLKEPHQARAGLPVGFVHVRVKKRSNSGSIRGAYPTDGEVSMIF